ncbi:MAG: hypothetical protein GY733_03155, partial [bacterium]|nr:hypothetical protein [bacterium]
MSTGGNSNRNDRAPNAFALSALRDSIEFKFGRLGRIIYHNAWLTITCVSVCAAALLTQLPYVIFDTSTENLLRTDDPVRIRFDE